MTPVTRPTTVASGQVVWVKKLEQTHTIEKVVQEAMNMIYTGGREGKKKEERINTVDPRPTRSV